MLRHPHLGIAGSISIGQVIGVGLAGIEHHAARNFDCISINAACCELVCNLRGVAYIVNRTLQLAIGEFGAGVPAFAQGLFKAEDEFVLILRLQIGRGKSIWVRCLAILAIG
ncbi:hypothetical protein XAUC_06420 [Xanthomonas citri pv. aurantifolii str. ICPB 10535]|nr:hypothetical protein XAUC_06420 [Xanthomonas citri pv. aurantifolii str. ICPB 10535]